MLAFAGMGSSPYPPWLTPGLITSSWQIRGER
jgi:hypothetical protein